MKPQSPNSLNQLIKVRYSRRQFLRDSAVLLGGLSLGPAFGCTTSDTQPQVVPGLPSSSHRVAQDLFGSVDPTIQDAVKLPEGFESQVLIAWGDPLLPDSASFQWPKQSAADQCKQFGYNCDYVGYIALEPVDGCLERGLLCVNHEYTVGAMMFAGYPTRQAGIDGVTQEEADVEAAAIGHSVVEIRRTSEGWRPFMGPLNRRFTLLETPMQLSGPVAGHARVKTSLDPEGRTVIGTLANCSGGVTPWGTVLFCEENINDYFSGDLPATHEATERNNFERYRMKTKPRYPFHRYDARFQIGEHPHEPNRFGWVVEYDPTDPTSIPTKRTSLGRFMREAATVVLNHTGHIVVYSGDDNYFEYMYKWVSHQTFNPNDRKANRDLLDSGDLFVARCDSDGSLTWLPLTFGQGKLTPENGFQDQADVMIETRRAADLVGATQMDRPEDVETNPVTGKVYAMLTKNKKRTSKDCDGPNPRPENHAGHILEMTPPSAQGKPDHTSRRFTWDVFALGGASEPNGHVDENTLANPDNATFDQFGRLWITSDGTQDSIKTADGVWVCETEGLERAKMKRFVSVPIGAEATGPCFTPDETTFFLAVQHPGHSRGSALSNSTSRWPHGDASLPPRPAIVAIRRKDGQPITV